MNKTILLVVGIAILTLAVGTATSVSELIPSAHAKKTGGGGAGAVPLIPIQTGNKALDKTIQSFYSLIKKTGHTGGASQNHQGQKSSIVTQRRSILLQQLIQ